MLSAATRECQHRLWEATVCRFQIGQGVVAAAAGIDVDGEGAGGPPGDKADVGARPRVPPPVVPEITQR